MIKIPRESVVPIYARITDADDPDTDVRPVELAVAKTPARPTVWVSALFDEDDNAYYLTGSLPPGKYRLFAKVSDAPFAPVIESDEFFRIT